MKSAINALWCLVLVLGALNAYLFGYRTGKAEAYEKMQAHLDTSRQQTAEALKLGEMCAKALR